MVTAVGIHIQSACGPKWSAQKILGPKAQNVPVAAFFEWDTPLTRGGGFANS